MRRIPLTAATLALALAGAAFAESHVSDEVAGAVNARQSHMTLYAFNLGPIGGMLRGRMDYDAEIAAAAANNLAALANIDQGRYWVEGSSVDDIGEMTEAKADIWSDMDGFNENMQALATATTELAAVAGDGMEAMQAAFGPVGQACGACHENYRVESE